MVAYLQNSEIPYIRRIEKGQNNEQAQFNFSNYNDWRFTLRK